MRLADSTIRSLGYLCRQAGPQWNISVFDSLGRTVGPAGPFFPSCLPGTLLNTATYAQALSHVASLKGKIGLGRGGIGREGGDCLASLLSLLSKLLLLSVTAGSQAPPISTLAVLISNSLSAGECY